MRIKAKHVFTALCTAFAIYSLSIYLVPFRKHLLTTPETVTGSRGRLVWQNNNCESCHQLYGLGGYLGPDLTNVYSAKGKGPVYIKAMIHSGTNTMPSFSLSAEEETDLLQFLKITDASGISDPRIFRISSFGMIHRK